MSAIPLADARELRGLARRTRLIQAGLALVLVALIAALALSGRSVHDVRRFSTLPLRTDAIIVLDVSASDWETGGVGAALQSVVNKGGHYGLLLESNETYEALPPGTPAVDLKPLLRYFVLPAAPQHGLAPSLPPNPWEPEFTSGDDFSLALTDAAYLAIDQPGRAKPGVIFISDLGDGPNDWDRLPEAIALYHANHITLRVVATDPDPQDVDFFAKLLGDKRAVITINTNAPATPPQVIGGFPDSLAALVAAAAAVLTLAVYRGARLSWSGAEPRESREQADV